MTDADADVPEERHRAVLLCVRATVAAVRVDCLTMASPEQAPQLTERRWSASVILELLSHPRVNLFTDERSTEDTRVSLGAHSPLRWRRALATLRQRSEQNRAVRRR